MRFVLYSSWFPVCVAVHLARAAQRAKLDVVTCGPTSGSRMPWPGAERVRYPAFRPDCATIDEALEREPDLWIDVDGDVFADRELPIPRRLVATDPHVPGERWKYERQRQLVGDPAGVFVMQSPYCRPGEAWLPYGYDPEWYRPWPDVRRDHDVTVLGAPYPERRRIAFALRERGLRVLGPGFGGMGSDHARELCRAPVTVVWPLKDDLPGRVFEAAACEVFAICRTVPDLRRIGYGAPGDDDTPETIEHVIQAGAHVAELAKAGALRPQPKIGPEHAWDARLAQLLEGRLTP